MDTLGFFIHELWLPYLVIAPCDFLCKENEQKCSSISYPTHRPVVRISDPGSATWVSSTSELSRGRKTQGEEGAAIGLACANALCLCLWRKEKNREVDDDDDAASVMFKRLVKEESIGGLPTDFVLLFC